MHILSQVFIILSSSYLSTFSPSPFDSHTATRLRENRRYHQFSTKEEAEHAPGDQVRLLGHFFKHENKDPHCGDIELSLPVSGTRKHSLAYQHPALLRYIARHLAVSHQDHKTIHLRELTA